MRLTGQGDISNQYKREALKAYEEAKLSIKAYQDDGVAEFNTLQFSIESQIATMSSAMDYIEDGDVKDLIYSKIAELRALLSTCKEKEEIDKEIAEGERDDDGDGIKNKDDLHDNSFDYIYKSVGYQV